MFERLEYAKMRLESIRGPVLPKLERRCKRLSDLKPENQERTRRFIKLRFSEPDAEEVRDLNLFCNRLAAYEDLCPGAQKICRRLYGQASGLIETRRRIEHAVAVHG